MYNLEALRGRLILYNGDETHSINRMSQSMLSKSQQKRLRSARRFHAALTFDDPTIKTEFNIPKYILSQQNQWMESRKKVNDAVQISEETKLREMKYGSTAIDISRDICAPLSNASVALHKAPSSGPANGDPFTPTLSLSSPSSIAAIAASGKTTNRFSFNATTVMQPATGAEELAEHVKMQKYLCKGCRNPLKTTRVGLTGKTYEARFCHFTGYYYCRNCHSGVTKHIVPARAIQLWDFEPYPVCDEVGDYLELMYDKPIVCLSAIRPQLYDSCLLLKVCRELRVQLTMLHAIGSKCPRFCQLFYAPPMKKERESLHDESSAPPTTDVAGVGGTTYVTPESRYLVEDSECWSVRDLQIISESACDSQFPDKTAATRFPMTSKEQNCPIHEKIRRVRSQMVRHIAQGCQGFCNFIAAKSCGACTVDEVIYSFDVMNVTTCSRCETAFHKRCWNKLRDGCPNCAVIATRAVREKSDYE